MQRERLEDRKLEDTEGYLMALSHTKEEDCKNRRGNLITVQQDATYSVYCISVGASTCFG